MTRCLILLMAGLLSLLVAPGRAEAACNGVGCSCTVTATAVSFGSYNPIASTTNDATGTVQVTCTMVIALAGSYTIDISSGSSGNVAQRTLKQGANSLNYNLYTDPARSIVWGDGTGGSSHVSPTFTALLFVQQSVTVYGRIPAGQNVAAGVYGDTITVTVTY
jgi:spore coat protein U-like protein